MYLVSEIGDQMKSYWYGRFLGYLVKEIHEKEGRTGERLIREAMRNYGERKGKLAYEELKENAEKTDLNGLYLKTGYCGLGPQFCRDVVRDTGEWQELEVHACPLERSWRDLLTREEQAYYCEEVLRSLLKGYTGEIGQAHIAKRLTSVRDVVCIMSYYYRRVYMDDERLALFSSEKETESPIMIDRDMLMLYESFYNMADHYPMIDLKADLAQALQKFADEVVVKMPKEAEATVRIMDEEFIREFYPLPVKKGMAGKMVSTLTDQAIRIFEINVVDRINNQWFDGGLR